MSNEPYDPDMTAEELLATGAVAFIDTGRVGVGYVGACNVTMGQWTAGPDLGVALIHCNREMGHEGNHAYVLRVASDLELAPLRYRVSRLREVHTRLADNHKSLSGARQRLVAGTMPVYARMDADEAIERIDTVLDKLVLRMGEVALQRDTLARELEQERAREEQVRRAADAKRQRYAVEQAEKRMVSEIKKAEKADLWAQLHRKDSMVPPTKQPPRSKRGGTINPKGQR